MRKIINELVTEYNVALTRRFQEMPIGSTMCVHERLDTDIDWVENSGKFVIETAVHFLEPEAICLVSEKHTQYGPKV